MRNKSTDLNNHLFEMLERLNDDEVIGDKLEEEIQRAKAITDVSKSIIENAKLSLDAAKLTAEYSGRVVIPDMIGVGNGE